MLSNNFIRYRSKESIFILIIAILICLIPSLRLSAQTDPKPHAVIHKANWDFGYLPQKCEVSHRFYINNEGTAPLTVTKIKPGCSCTSVTKIEAPIPPGDSAAVDVTFKSGRYHHQVRKTTRILTADRKKPELPLNIRAYMFKDGEATGPVALKPNKLKIKITDEKYAFETGTVIITNKSTDTLDVSVKYMPEEYILLEEIPERLVPGEQAPISLSVREGTIDKNTSGLSCTLVFTAGDTTLITVPLEINR